MDPRIEKKRGTVNTVDRRAFFLIAGVLACGCGSAEPGPSVEAPQDDGPWITALHPQRPGAGSTMKISGRRLARLGSQTWVRFHPDLWVEVENAAEGELILRVPRNVANGPILVRVGSEQSNFRNLALCPTISAPPPTEKEIIRDKDGYALTTTCDLSVWFHDFHGIDDAEALAAKYKAKVVGALPSMNSFTLRFSGTTLPDLLKLDDSIEKEPGVRSVLLPLGLRPR
jgi:hypothetical protein